MSSPAFFVRLCGQIQHGLRQARAIREAAPPTRAETRTDGPAHLLASEKTDLPHLAMAWARDAGGRLSRDQLAASTLLTKCWCMGEGT